MLNATKALLTAKSVPFSNHHGVAGESREERTCLANEICSIKGAGLLPELAWFYGGNLSEGKVSLKDVLYNIPFVHRAYVLTYRGAENLFIPIGDAHFVRQTTGDEAWFCATLMAPRYQKDAFIQKQGGWERDHSEHGSFVIRSKRRLPC